METFLTLCIVLNYTKTAELLHITQPAVTQHIKYLERSYCVKLFHFSGKTLSLTREGKVLYEFSVAMKTSSDKVKTILATKEEKASLKFGTTLTIGEYTMSSLLKKLLHAKPLINLSMQVSNTASLLSKLHEGTIDFAIVEGHFDKSKFGFSLFKEENFIGICSPTHEFANRRITFNEILNENLILREEGSGTRNIFEQILYELNFTTNSLEHFIEIGNMKIIKELVAENIGISFLYRESVKEELEKGILTEIKIEDFNINREFNFVFLKGSLHEEEYKKWFQYFIENL